MRHALSSNTTGNSALESKLTAAKKRSDEARRKEEKCTADFAVLEKRDVKTKEDIKHVSAQV